MPINVEWGNSEHSVIIRRFRGKWDWGDFQAASDELNMMLSEVDDPVISILDLSKSAAPPPGVFARAKALMDNIDPAVEMTIVVGINVAVRRVFDIISQVFNARFAACNAIMVTTMEEAYKVIGAKTIEHDW